MKTYLYRAQIRSLSLLFWPQFRSGSQFLAPAKNCRFLRFIHILENGSQGGAKVKVI